MTQTAQIAESGLLMSKSSAGTFSTISNNPSENQSVSDAGTDFSNILDEQLADSSTSDNSPRLLLEGVVPADESLKLPPSGKISPLIASPVNDSALVSDIVTDASDNPELAVIQTISSENLSNQIADTDNAAKLRQPLLTNSQATLEGITNQQNISKGQYYESIENSRAQVGINSNDDYSVDQNNKQQGTPDISSKLLNPLFTLDLLPRQGQLNRYIEKISEKGDSAKLISESLMPEAANSTNLTANLNNSLAENKVVNQLTLPLPVSSPHWANDFSDRVRWLIGSQIQKADLTLNPRNMGVIEISITVNNDQTSIQIVAQNASARDAVENSLGRLREMLGEAGVNLVDVDVSQHPGHDSTPSERQPHQFTDGYDKMDIAEQIMLEQPISDNYSLIDFYA